ncbi:RNA polymerase sigma factor sigF, chloroplastic-like isoform X2 [Abrus precatorius]|nr:RNA polymerase sigma factor sigF, chloroplastic-like isoform X2 [Abrus precatorius]
MLREQASPTVASWSSSISAQNFPTSVLLQEQRDEYRPLLHMSKEDKSSQAILNTRQMDMASVHETNNIVNTDQVVLDFRKHLHLWPRLQSLLTSPPTGEIAASSTLQHVSIDAERPTDGVQCNGVSLAKKALSGSKHASSVVEDLKSFKADDDSIPCGLASTSLADPSLGSNKTVRSTRLLERRLKQRKVPKSKVKDDETYLARKNDAKERLRMERKINEEFDQNDPLRSFLWAPETKQLLTLEQESQLIAQIQDLLRLEELKTRLQSQFGREPTMAEWAEGAGLNCRMLHAQLRCGNRSREKLIQANLRMVVHVAKTYQGRGLSLQDLLQEGSMGLMKSVEKFNPLAGCRFGNYAFWWIRQAIRKAVFRHSRTIRLPEKVYILLGKVMEAKKLYIQEGNLHPTKEELARRVGITVERIDNLLFAARVPISMQQTVWADQDTTFQEITADTTIEATDVSVEKQLMRRHVLNVLSILLPKERRIIRLRYGFEDGQQKSLSEIGDMFGLSRERVRQLEIRALYKLKKCLKKQGLEAYVDLLI